MNIENLNEKFINPALRYMFPEYVNSFKYGSNTSINQSEICLYALSCKSNELIKSESIQVATDLTITMVYYRVSQKLNWLLEKVERKWKLKKRALQVISHFLKLIGEIEYLLDDMEKTTKRTFGLEE